MGYGMVIVYLGLGGFMKVKRIFLGILALVFISSGLWGMANAAPKENFVKKDKKIEKKESERKSKPKTKFALNKLDAVKVNQLLLLTSK